LTKAKSYRYELKYVIDPKDIFRLESVIKLHPANFKKAFPNRRINNIYFDTIANRSSQENLNGISNRTKIRYRWYDDSQEGTLEFKIKKNALGRKEYFPISKPETVELLNQSVQDTFPNQVHLFPILQNVYVRRYFTDASESFRLTIDSDIAYQIPQGRLASIQNPQFAHSNIIVELKFDKKADNADFISKNIPFRLSKHSKYTTGMFALYS